jgi:UDP-glucose 4-epimerase
MSSVLVIGGTGTIGSWVTRRLVERGSRVVTYSRRPDTTLLKDIVGKFESVAGDIMDLPALIQAIKQYEVDRVVHMSALLTRALEANLFMGYRVNVDGTLNVFEACRLMGVKRVVYASAKAVYAMVQGQYGHPTYKPIDEDYPKAPYSVYGATKFFTENMGLFYHQIHGLDIVIVRFAVTYGPGKQARRGALGISSAIIESAMFEKPITVTQDVDKKNDMIYNRDVANGIALACFAENLEHRVFHLGTGVGVSLRNIIEIARTMFKGAAIEIGSGPLTPSGSNHCVFNIDRARRELGYQPQYDLEAGIRDYVDTMRRLGMKPVLS